MDREPHSWWGCTHSGLRATGFDSWDTSAGSVWRGRAGHYLTNPAAEPDPANWEVDVAYLAL